jgi:hypothetical protein
MAFVFEDWFNTCDCFTEDWVVNWFLEVLLGRNIAEALNGSWELAAHAGLVESWLPRIPLYPCLIYAL